MIKRNFAAFIITYERPELIVSTIKKIQIQSVCPEKILIVDNSATTATYQVIDGLHTETIEYYRTGYNAGPAGGAALGLSILSNQGYDWIYWGDDNDPPETDHTFEQIFGILNLYTKTDAKVGILGLIGGKFNRLTGRTANFKNKDLTGIMDADYVAGGKQMIVNASVVREGALPTEKLFFGFEDLDFSLQTKRLSYKILFDGLNIKKLREDAGNKDSSYRWKGKSFGNEAILWRQYYSTRSLLFIFKENDLWVALVYNIVKLLVKNLYSFRYGWYYGMKHGRIQTMAIMHFMAGRYGKTDLTSFLK